MHVLDTDTLVDLLRRRTASPEALRALEDEGPLATTAVTVQELYDGIGRMPDPPTETQRVERALLGLDVLPLDRAAAQRAGAIGAALAKKGTPIGDLDTAIAGITLHHGATLVSRNVRHFARVPGLRVRSLDGPDS